MLKFSIILATILLSTTPTHGKQVVSPSLEQALEAKGSADVTILFSEGVHKAYTQIRSLRFETITEKMTALRSALIANSESSQTPALQLIGVHQTRRRQQAGSAPPEVVTDIHFQHHWISNTITIRNADAPLVQELAQLEGISEIREMIVIPQAPIRPGVDEDENGVHGHNPAAGVQWGVQKIGGNTLWARRITGRGIIVASIDTGVRGTHVLLKSNFLGDYGWFDPERRTPFPVDSAGHGTHTMGTIAGSGGYGVAPGARWMACKAAAWDGSLPEDYLLSCGQFMVCPTHPNGSNSDCGRAPHVINNSWGSTSGGRSWYDNVIKAWRSAGIIPIFSGGNNGPKCQTVGSPGDRPGVISVAASDLHDYLASFSSRGPARGLKRSEFKPEITAPGFNIKSAWHTSDTATDTVSGTSMAGPHVTGAVALLLQEDSRLVRNYDGVRSVLLKGADRKGLLNYGQDCGGVETTVYPNYGWGYGRLNVTVSSRLN